MKHWFYILAPIVAAGVCLLNPVIGVLLLGLIWLAREMNKSRRDA